MRTQNPSFKDNTNEKQLAVLLIWMFVRRCYFYEAGGWFSICVPEYEGANDNKLWNVFD